MDSKTWWYLARASGLVAWALLAASVLWGILLSSRILGDRRRPAWLLDLHRWLGGLAVTFTGVHVAGLVADSYVHFGALDVLVPFASGWKPLAVAGGVVAMWLLVAVELTSLMMRRLPRRWWRAVHLTSYGTFWIASLHGAAAGTDASSPLYRWGSAATVLALVWAASYRILTRNERGARRAPTAGPGRTAGRSAVPVPNRAPSSATT